MVIIKNGRGPLGLRTLKSAVSEEWIDQLGCFFACWYKFRKGKNLIIIGWAWSKMGMAL